MHKLKSTTLWTKWYWDADLKMYKNTNLPRDYTHEIFIGQITWHTGGFNNSYWLEAVMILNSILRQLQHPELGLKISLVCVGGQVRDPALTSVSCPHLDKTLGLATMMTLIACVKTQRPLSSMGEGISEGALNPDGEPPGLASVAFCCPHRGVTHMGILSCSFP